MIGRIQDHQERGARVHRVSVAVNGLLAAGKLAAGLVAGSPALLADGAHSMADMVTSFVSWLSFHWAGKPADEDHHYGHGKAEALAAAFVGAVLTVGGVLLALQSVQGEGHPYERGLAMLALTVAVGSVAANEWLARLALRTAEDIGSPSLVAVGRDCRSDALSSLLVVAGVGTALLGYPAVEPIAAAGIGLMIVVMGLKTMRESFDILMDRAPDPHLRGEIIKLAQSLPGVVEVESVSIHPLGHHLRVDMEIAVDGGLSVRKGHAIADSVEESVIAYRDAIVQAAVHVHPAEVRTDRALG